MGGGRNMNTLEHLQNAIDYIETHLDSSLKLEDIAIHSNYSPYHFHNLFSALTGMGVMDYVRRRRLSEAGMLFIRHKAKVLDIAVHYDYESAESFSKAFKKQHHYTPSEIKKRKGSLQTTFPIKITHNQKGAVKMKMRIEEKESVNIAGYQKTFSYENGANLKEIPMFWDEINQSAKDLDLFKMNDHKIEGIVGLCQQASDGFMTYLIGTSCDFQEGLVNVELPKSRWLVFDAVGALPQSVQNTWRDIVSLYLPTCSEEIDGSMDLEVYSQEDPNSESLVTEIWLRIKA